MTIWDDIKDSLDFGGKVKHELDEEKDDIQARLDEEVAKVSDLAFEIEEDIKLAAIYGGIAIFIGIGGLVLFSNVINKPKKSKPVNQKPIKKSKPVNSLPDDDQDVVKKLF